MMMKKGKGRQRKRKRSCSPTGLSVLELITETMRIKRTWQTTSREGFLKGPNVTPPDVMDHMYNFDTVCDPEMALRPPTCTISHASAFLIIGRLEEGEQAIVLNLVIEPTDHGQHFRCTALIDTGATGLFIDRAYTVQM
jgi:hypothetical protein